MDKSQLPHEAPRFSGPGFIILAAVLWSTAGVGIKSLSLPPLAAAGWRSVFSLPVLAVFGGVRGLRTDLLRQYSFVATAVSYALTLCFFVAATKLTTAANAILLQYTSPVWVIVLSIVILGERPRLRECLVAAGCFAGLLLFFLDKISPAGMIGIICALLSGITMSIMVVGLRHEGMRGVQSTAMNAVFAGNSLCIFLCLPWMVGSFTSIHLNDWSILALLGSVQLALSYVFFTRGLQKVAALRATLLGLLEPILNPLWVALGSGEMPGKGALLGGAIILACLAFDAAIPRSSPTPP